MKYVIEPIKDSSNKIIRFLSDRIIVNNDTIKVSNLSKIFWPKEGYTKKDVFDYYLKISNYILPFLSDKPLMVKRFPNGINSPGFYQKNFSQYHLPEWFATKEIPLLHSTKRVLYPVVNNLQSLLYLVNLGTIEFHTWHSTTKHLNQPDYFIIDLDPLEIEFSFVVKTANVIHKYLGLNSIQGFCKTSGSRGLHIYGVLKNRIDFASALDLAKNIVIEVKNELPHITSLNRQPLKRKGKIYLDVLQNNFAQTSIAPYSLRAQKNATVSTPIQWKELNENLNPIDFNLKSIPLRLNKVGEVWKGFFSK